MSSTDLLRTLELQRAAEDVTHRYQRLVDAKDLDGLAHLVTDDVVLRRQDGERHGREQFLDLYRRFADSDVEVAQHMVTNVQVTELDPDEGNLRLQVDSCFLAITTHTSGEARLMWGRYCDDLVPREGRWLLSAKRIALVRTAYVEESALADPALDSFGPRNP
jgi:ketosteroid isomerase-like protein